MSIRDGYAILAFDYRIEKSKDDCIFNMDLKGDGSTASKQQRMIEMIQKKVGDKFGSISGVDTQILK